MPQVHDNTINLTYTNQQIMYGVTHLRSEVINVRQYPIRSGYFLLDYQDVWLPHKWSLWICLRIWNQQYVPTSVQERKVQWHISDLDFYGMPCKEVFKKFKDDLFMTNQEWSVPICVLTWVIRCSRLKAESQTFLSSAKWLSLVSWQELPTSIIYTKKGKRLDIDS